MAPAAIFFVASSFTAAAWPMKSSLKNGLEACNVSHLQIHNSQFWTPAACRSFRKFETFPGTETGHQLAPKVGNQGACMNSLIPLCFEKGVLRAIIHICGH